MTGRSLTLLAALSLAAPCAAQQAPHPAVCRVVVDEAGGQAFGSGTLIDARGGYGLVITNWHVVRDATGLIETRFPDGFRSAARPLKLDHTWDLAALVIWRPPAVPVRLAEEPPRPGDPLLICGYGQGRYRAAAGRCTDYYAPEIGLPLELVELNVEARQGDSGGPIFNQRGELAGVLFGAGRGTTLGSFQGRVRTFLASVAPDIGAPAPPADGPRALLGAPLLAAGPDANDADSPAADAPSRLEPVARVANAAQAAVGADRPQKLAAHTETPPVIEPTPGAPVAATASDGIDWREDGQSLLALLGVAAILAAAFRATTS